MAENTTGLVAGMNTTALGAGLDPAKMPGRLLLARLGKRVLRPGGRELTVPASTRGRRSTSTAACGTSSHRRAR